MCTFMRFSAHFGHWLEVSRRGRNVRQWQVAARLIYGQVKKSYRRRRAGAGHACGAPGDTGRSHSRWASEWASLDG